MAELRSPESSTSSSQGLEEASPVGRSNSGQHKRPRSGAKPTHVVTVPKPFSLGLNRRVEERAGFEDGLRKRTEAADEREKLREHQRKREEERELKEFRKQLQFKATPVRKYRGITVNPSFKELTVPEEPQLSTSDRNRDITSSHSDGASSRGSHASYDCLNSNHYHEPHL